MSENLVPVLCFGTFFTLVLTARPGRTGTRNQVNVIKDNLSESEILKGLIKVVKPNYVEPSSIAAFRTLTSEYKNCKNSGEGLQLFDHDIELFDKKITTDYSSILPSMVDFIAKSVDIEGVVEYDNRLVKPLIDLIYSDKSISVKDEFHICRNGSILTKEDIYSLSEVCLPSFLLGLLHYILINRHDNTIGRETIDDWCTPGDHTIRKYRGSMGSSINQKIAISMQIDDEVEISPEDIKCTDCKQDIDIPNVNEYERSNDDSSEHTSTRSDESLKNVSTQPTFTNHGDYVFQINNAGILNIDIDKSDRGPQPN